MSCIYCSRPVCKGMESYILKGCKVKKVSVPHPKERKWLQETRARSGKNNADRFWRKWDLGGIRKETMECVFQAKGVFTLKNFNSAKEF